MCFWGPGLQQEHSPSERGQWQPHIVLIGNHPDSWKALLPLFCADQDQHGTGSLSCHVFIQHLVQQSLDVISPFSCNDTNNGCKAFPPDLSQLQTSNSPWLSSPWDPISTFSSTSTGFHGKGQCSSGPSSTVQSAAAQSLYVFPPGCTFKALIQPLEKFTEHLPLTWAGFGSGAASKICPSQIPVTRV